MSNCEVRETRTNKQNIKLLKKVSESFWIPVESRCRLVESLIKLWDLNSKQILSILDPSNKF